MRRFPLALSLLGGLFLSPAPAAAYVRSYTTQGCHPVYWAQSCVFITPDSDGVPEMNLTDVERVAQEAIDSWEKSTNGSSFLRLKYLAANGKRETAALDGLQVIKFRADTWCRPGDSADADPVCYDPAAAALTTVTYLNKPMDATTDGKIVDADIELNAVYNYFYDADTNPNPRTDNRKPADLWNTLTHELGHLQGLEHTCRRGSFDSMPSCTRDNTGQPVISCTTVEQGKATNPDLAVIFNTTMYPTADPRETKKRIPKADDLAGVINTYPQINDPRICKMPDAAKSTATGCAAAPHKTGGTGALFGLLLLSAAALLRRRRKSAL